MARAFKENINREEFDAHKRRVNCFITQMNDKDIIALEENFMKQHHELYKKPERIEDVYFYRSPDMIKKLMGAVEEYKKALQGKTK